MTEIKEQLFNSILYNLKEILFKKVPDLDYRYAKMQNLDFADFEELKKINDELDGLRAEYVKLRDELIATDKEQGNIEIRKLNKEIRMIKGEVFNPSTAKKSFALYKGFKVYEKINGDKIASKGNQEIEFRNISEKNFDIFLKLLNKIWN